ncbi:related to actin-related protein [Rhynchosporium graminicola]|uniref:Related to actin-related protein n=1 Tax=Rhynchosporium graminicola TaxID=2792576 RepID=A0A1E1L2Z4_9HELO|nr:related to actin-related protein [Rhynchosporium commune]
MPPFKDDHILIIAPGSQTTLAQFGLPESFTPASHRFRTRVFLAPDGKSYEAHKIVSRKKQSTTNGDVEMDRAEGDEEEEELVELPEEEEGAIWPLKEGRIDDMPAFFAFLEHVKATFNAPLHTPVLLIAQPCWTAKNHEDLTQFIFEKFKTPALCIMDSALATSYAFGIPSATIIDVGFEKVDVTAITDYQISGRSTVHESGGEAMTRKLKELLKSQEFTRDMAEQLKKSTICEILPPGVPLPGTVAADVPVEGDSNPAAAATTGASSSGPDVKITEAPRVPFLDDVDEEFGIDDRAVEDDGVLDIATIVTSGKTQDFLAKKEKEKAERAAARKADREAAKEAAAAAAAKPLRLPNSKRPRATFHYEEFVKDASNAKRQKTPEAATTVDEPLSAVEPKPDDGIPPVEGAAVSNEDDAARRENNKAVRKEEKRKALEDKDPSISRKDIEIGIERFQAASDGYLDAIADSVYRTVLSVNDISKRQEAWDALVICGQGSKVRGFKDALITTLNNRYLVSPSSATMFMSELPSNLATPSGTGSMTPTASFSSPLQAPPTASAVNPLLLAATTASHQGINPNISTASFGGQQAHSSHSQSPTSIKVASPPTYFPEWKSFDEAVFLGAQVAAKVIFVVDQGASKGFLSRVEFNEEGPTAIHQVGLLY